MAEFAAYLIIKDSICNLDFSLYFFVILKDYTDNFDWLLKTGPSYLNQIYRGRTGTKIDHSLGTTDGGYMLATYMQSPTVRHTPGQKTRLDSPPIQATTGSCLQFWLVQQFYFLNELNIGH